MYGNPYAPSPMAPGPVPMNFQSGFQPNLPPFLQGPQAPAQQMTSGQLGMSVGQVATVENVEQIQLQPNERRIVMVQSQPVIAMRSADNMGLVSTRYFQLVEFDPRSAQTETAAEYAPLAAVQELRTQIADLSQQLSDLRGAVRNEKPTSKRSADS